jgi:hypothetical protein
MKRCLILALSVISGVAHASDPLTVTLRATSYNAGKTAQAFLLPRGEKTLLDLRFSGVPPYVGSPVHVYTYIYAGSCKDLPAKPAWSLNDRVLAQRVAGASRAMLQLSHTVAAPIDALRGGRYAIALRTAPADGDQLLFCGDIA